MVAPGSRHTGLIPPLPFARGVTESVQHGGNLVIAVANGHATNNLQRLHGRRCLGCRTWPLHDELGVRTSLPMYYQLQVFLVLVRAHDDLFDRGAENHLLECRRAVITVPDISKVLTHPTDSVFLFK